MDRELITLNGITIGRGENKIIRIPVETLPSGNHINMVAHVFRGTEPGPAVMITGGVHGDEINGIQIVRNCLSSGIFETLLWGSVIAIPLVNVYGFLHFSRDVPDGKDINRSFPGLPKGSLASRLAYILSKHILPQIDFGLDFHTGGLEHYNHPQIRYTEGDEAARALAAQFNAPITLANRPPSQSLRKQAFKVGKPILTFEGGENSRFDGFSILSAKQGILNVLSAQGMIDAQPVTTSSHLIHSSSWLRAPVSGIFTWFKNSGQRVTKGELLGQITDPYHMAVGTNVYASDNGLIIGHSNSTVVMAGDALFHIGMLAI